MGFIVFALLVSVLTGGMVWGLHHLVFKDSLCERAELDLLQLDGDLEEYAHRTGQEPPRDVGLGVLLLDMPDGTHLRRSLPTDPWGRAYQYEVVGFPGGTRVALRCLGANAADPADDIVHVCTSLER